MMRVAHKLINGRPARLSFTARRYGSKGSRCAIKVRVDAAHIAAHMIDVAHDEQLVFQRFERLEHIVETFVL